MASRLRGSSFIDVNQNRDLASFSYRPSSPSHSRLVSELHEKVKSYKRELAKKDEMINELSSLTPRTAHYSSSRVKTDTHLWDDILHDGHVSSGNRAFEEAATLKLKVENLSAEIDEYQSKMDLKDKYVRDLKTKMDVMNENSLRQESLIQALRERVQKTESESGLLENATTRGSVTIKNLQKENREQSDRIMDLESRLRDQAVVNEEAQQSTGSSKRKLQDLLSQLCDALNCAVDVENADDTFFMVVEKVRGLSQDHILLESKIQTLEDALGAHDLETKASRETIMRLVSEVGKEQKSVSETNFIMEKLKKDCEDAVFKQQSVERENEILKDRITALDKALNSAQEELTNIRNKTTAMSGDVRHAEYEKGILKSELQTFKESLAKMLSDPGYFELDAREDSIKSRIKSLVSSEREKSARIDSLENALTSANKQLEQQCELYQETIRRAKKAETSTYHQESRLRDLENEIITGGVVQDAMRNDKNKYLQFLQQMAEAMNMEEVARDIGYDMNTDVLIARAYQLSKLESDALVQKTSANHNLYRKIKTLKERMQSKELHMELLRKKLAQLEEKEQTRSALVIDREDAIVTVQKLHKKVERLQHALGDERVKVTQLKAQLAETNQLKTVTLEQRRRMDELNTMVEKLSASKGRQKHQLSSLKKELKMTEFDADENSGRLRTQMEAVTNDLKSTKGLLDEMTRREKQLVDFREVVARMLGLDVTSLAIPDYEVISRLEKLIRNHHIGNAAAVTFENSMGLMNPQFASGYNDLVPADYPFTKHSRGRSTSPRRHHRHHHRPKSTSPCRY